MSGDVRTLFSGTDVLDSPTSPPNINQAAKLHPPQTGTPPGGGGEVTRSPSPQIPQSISQTGRDSPDRARAGGMTGGYATIGTKATGVSPQQCEIFLVNQPISFTKPTPCTIYSWF